MKRPLAPIIDLARRRLAGALDAVYVPTRAAIDRVDPNDDPEAEPISVPASIALLVAICASATLYFKYRMQPMQDLGHHLALAAVVADWGRPGSLYTDLYERFDPLNANALLYWLSGTIGRYTSVTAAVRGAIAAYVIGVPLASAYALRVFGRSLWGAVIVVPLVYDMNYVAGFANLLFAGPLFVLTFPVGYRALRDGTLRWAVAFAVLLVLLFLAHVHAFLWAGGLLFLMTCVATARIALRGATPLESLTGAARRAGIAAAAALPSLLLFFRWYRRAFGSARAEGGVMATTSGWENHFGAWFMTPSQCWSGLSASALRRLKSEDDLTMVAALFGLTALAIAFGTMHRKRRPPVLELACALTFASYFLLPEGLQGHDVLASRQPSIAMWLWPAFVTPVPFRVSRLGRAVVICGALAFTYWSLTSCATRSPSSRGRRSRASGRCCARLRRECACST